MRLFLVFASIMTLCVALASTLMVIIALGDATGTVDASVSSTIDSGRTAMQGFVTLDIEVQEGTPIHDEIAAVKGLPS